jgi:hypothetical protein
MHTPFLRDQAVPSLLLVALFVAGAQAQQQEAMYRFKAGEPVFYEVKVGEERAGEGRLRTFYLKYRPASVDAAGQTKLRYDWGLYTTTETVNGGTRTSHGGLPAFLAGPQPADDFPGLEVLIDPRGNVVDLIGAGDPRQLDNMLGAIHSVGVVPLPPAGQTAWTTQRELTIYTETKRKEPGGPWGSRDVNVRTERGAQEVVKYEAAPVVDGMLTVKREYSLVSKESVNGTPTDQLTGSGSYVFDVREGLLQSCDMKLALAYADANVTLKMPVTLSARRLPADELAKLKAQVGEAIAKRAKQEEERKRQEATGASDVRELPQGMTKTAQVGGNGGGEFVKVNKEGRLVIGFRLRNGNWGGKKVVGEIVPLYEKPTDKPPHDRVDFVAKDGYAVGGLWVNGDDTNACAIRVIFMKKTDKGLLDPKQAYVAPWFGELQGPSRVKLGGDGHPVVGIFGRQGLNTAAVGLVQSEPDPTDDPNYKGPSDPTDDPNFEGTPAPKKK